MSLTSLFLISFLASTLLPGGSEVYFSYLVLDSQYPWFLLVTVAAVGNTLGGFTNWLIGRFIESQWSIKSKNKKILRASSWLSRWGAPVLLLSWLPIIGDPICLVAGYFRIHWLKSLIYILIGKTLRYWFLYYLVIHAP